MRVGFWRLLDALARRKVRATTPINAHVVEAYEPVARAMREAGSEFMAHGIVQGVMHLLPDQRKAIRQAVELVEKFTGKKPQGWLAPGLTETCEALDYLRAEGIEYVFDWVNDDQRYEIPTQSAPLVPSPTRSGATTSR
jgi:peptidoglycan/xylan/chitin deacetylase (PgdA/CDA1 family)